MYSSDVAAAKQGDELRKRLKANLECARTIFQSRVAMECPDAAGLFDEQLEAVIDTHRETPYGRDLATAAGRAELARGKRAAEAS